MSRFAEFRFPPPNSIPSIPYVVLVVSLACAVSIAHRFHLAYMFENDRHFSHLSTLERELTFRTETGFYYSYYKTLVEAPSIGDGMNLIVSDNRSEYGDTINTLHRFNLYPELVLSVSYRMFMSAMHKVGLPTAQCWKVRRAAGQTPVVSCEGLGEPIYFYIEGAFLINGLLVGIYFMFGVYLSESILGGVLTVICVAYNHRECTRVQWTPPLRESFAYPFFVLHLLAVTAVLKAARPRYNESFIFVAVTTTCFMLPWQFAQFALLTTTLSVFATYLLEFIDVRKFRLIVGAQAVGVLVGIVLLFFNRMIIASYLFSALITCLIISSLHSYINETLRQKSLILCAAGRVLFLMIVTASIKVFLTELLGVTDDEHIFDLVLSKLTDFRTFHTMLYTCAVEFDFMPIETLVILSKTLLLPAAIVAVLAMLVHILNIPFPFNLGSRDQPVNSEDVIHAFRDDVDTGRRQANKLDDQAKKETNRENVVSGSRAKEAGTGNHAELVYSVIQLGAFTVMATFFMRLKLFWTPYLCILTSLLASRKLFGRFGSGRNRLIALSVLIAVMSDQGIRNIRAEWNIVGEFEGPETEELVHWINKNVAQDAPFAGSMPTMATVKLCTGRPIVNHPHYEDAGLRSRSKRVYSLFSRKSPDEVWRTLRDMRVRYAVIEEAWCMGTSANNCSMVDLWDHEDVENRGRETFCEIMARDPEPYFKSVFHNTMYNVLELEETPSAFDGLDVGEEDAVEL